MTAAVPAARLKEAAAWANRSIANRPAVPVMGAAVLAVEDGTLTVSGWDWETLTRYTGGGSGDLERTLVNGRLLVDISARLVGDVELSRDGTRLRLKAGRNRFALDTMPGDEYPNEPKPSDEAGVLDGFGELIGRVAPSAGTPDSQPGWLHGVHIVAANGELAAVATDKYVISYSTAAWTGGDFTINVPARRIHEVAKQLDDKVTIGVGNGITVTDDNRYASILATDQWNANVMQYLGGDVWTSGHVDVDRVELSDAIDAVTPTVGQNRPVRLYFTDGGITVKSADQGVGEAESGLDCTLAGDERALAISPSYLTRALDATPADVVRINFGSTGRKPVLIHGLADGEPDPTTRHVVIPVRVDDIN